jgi:TonB family protein
MPLAIHAQTNADSLRERLLHQPLYLRGFWTGFLLEFDASGQPMGRELAMPGPLTLSGIDVSNVSVQGKKLVLEAQRVALVAGADGRLERRGLLSTTLMFGTMQKKYRAKEMVKIVVQADDAGNFDAPLRAIFANGLAQLAHSAPPYWRCYASGYFEQTTGGDPQRTVEDCAERSGAFNAATDEDSAPDMLTEPSVHGTREAAELNVSGESRVHFVVRPSGTPTDFQVVRAVGAGLDEATLQAVSECRFKPAMRDGIAIAAGLDFSMQYK